MKMRQFRNHQILVNPSEKAVFEIREIAAINPNKFTKQRVCYYIVNALSPVVIRLQILYIYSASIQSFSRNLMQF
jgi:hypothetical protein